MHKKKNFTIIRKEAGCVKIKMSVSENFVLGFQFEPRKNKRNTTSEDSDSSWTTHEDDSIFLKGSGGEEGRRIERKNMEVGEWCTCDKCSIMASETECYCCRKLEVSQITELGG